MQAALHMAVSPEMGRFENEQTWTYTWSECRSTSLSGIKTKSAIAEVESEMQLVGSQFA